MLKEGETLITRPTLFEFGCPTCPVANKFIRRALDGNLPKPWINLEVQSIEIECAVSKEEVRLEIRYGLLIRYEVNGPMQETQGGNLKPEPVNCPYFMA